MCSSMSSTSAGRASAVSSQQRPVAALIRWADVIFVMERKHLNRLRAEYARLLEHKRLHVLDIPDDYRFMDPELVDMLDDLVTSCLAV